MLFLYFGVRNASLSHPHHPLPVTGDNSLSADAVSEKDTTPFVIRLTRAHAASNPDTSNAASHIASTRGQGQGQGQKDMPN